MQDRVISLWALRVVALLGILSFWAAAAWDQFHPPVYHGPRGDESP